MAFEPAVLSWSEDHPRPAPLGPAATLATVGAVTGFAGVLASSCCVIPLALGSLGAGAGAFGALEAIAPWRLPILAGGGLALVGAWGLWWRKRVACAGASCAAPRRSGLTLGILALATKIMLAAAAWPLLEPFMMKLMRAA
jgi:mercuric ion transport protein